MMLMLSVSLVLGATLTVGCASGETATQQTPTRIIDSITPQDAFTLIQTNQNNPDFVIIDVRTPEEFADGYIENAIMIDYYTETFQNELDKLDKNKTYLIYCRSGGRSGNVLDIMEELNFKKVRDISGGILTWNSEGLPITK